MNWTHSCRRVAELLSLEQDEPLGWLDRLRLRMHLSMCDNCRHVEQQLHEVKALTGNLFSMTGEDDLLVGAELATAPSARQGTGGSQRETPDQAGARRGP